MDVVAHHAQARTIAYWHEPRFSFGYHGGSIQRTPIWQILDDDNLDHVLNGRDYTWFGPQDPHGIADSTKGGSRGTFPADTPGRAIPLSVCRHEWNGLGPERREVPLGER